MRRREFIGVLAGAMASVPCRVWAQVNAKPVRIGYLSPSQNLRLLNAFLSGLRDLNYTEGHNLTLDYRSSEGRSDLLAPRAAELVQSSPDVIVTLGASATRAAQRATSTIPIVFAPVGDAVQAGLVQSLARPGGNLTGMSINTWILNQKRLEILKETFPTVRRVAILGNGSNPSGRSQWEQIKEAGPFLRLDLLPVIVDGVGELGAGFEMMAQSGVDASAVLPDPAFDAAREQIVSLAAKHRLITIYEHRAFVESGGLMSYGPNLDRISYRAAAFVGRILNGTQPAELAVEQPTFFELLINLKTAKTQSVFIPQIILARADELIE